ncbi:hypothetical protein D9M72_405700 [compost metagenome]
MPEVGKSTTFPDDARGTRISRNHSAQRRPAVQAFDDFVVIEYIDAARRLPVGTLTVDIEVAALPFGLYRSHLDLEVLKLGGLHRRSLVARLVPDGIQGLKARKVQHDTFRDVPGGFVV